jgi:hypothetical protein
MARKRYKAEEIVAKLRQCQGRYVADAIRATPRSMGFARPSRTVLSAVALALADRNPDGASCERARFM